MRTGTLPRTPVQPSAPPAALTSRHGPRRRQTAIERGGADRHELLARGSRVKYPPRPGVEPSVG